MDKQSQFDAEENPSEPVSAQPVSSNKNNKLASPLPPGWRNTGESRKQPSSVLFSETLQLKSYFLLRLIGYGLLGLSLLDYLYIVIPPRFTNPLWELQLIGSLVDHVVAPLLGLLFIFYRPQGYITKGEKKLLKFLSTATFVLGLLYLLLLPLGLIDTWRLYYASNEQFSAQVSQQSEQFQRLKSQLQSAKTDQEIESLLASITPQGRLPKIEKPQEFKNQFLSQISQAEQNLQTQSQIAQATQRKALIKNSVKWNLGALIAGTLFMGIWHHTQWARQKGW